MKIIAIGRNYKEHVKELNNTLPAEPIFFLKPESALIYNNKPFFYPDFSKEIHHEVEIVIKINRLGKNILPKFAYRYYDEISLGIDFTARDLQDKAKTKGLPWEISKAFDGSAPIGKFLPKSSFSDIQNISFSLDINSECVQKGNTKNMIFSIDEIIAYVSKFLTLKIGDLIFTGTPNGVGPVKIGNRLTAYIENKNILDFFVK
ncbi:MAG: fumarylacetoacetate hydrolase family protein [Bacteroidales bacterium]|nr:fumarylacetoacetate hydrolase family protein [Bacteroidales bacterium]